jgi:hypothetical protein
MLAGGVVEHAGVGGDQRVHTVVRRAVDGVANVPRSSVAGRC